MQLRNCVALAAIAAICAVRYTNIGKKILKQYVTDYFPETFVTLFKINKVPAAGRYFLYQYKLLYSAVNSGNAEAAKALLRNEVLFGNGFNIHECSAKEKYYLLSSAVSNGHAEMVKILFENGLDIHELSTTEQYSFLSFAVFNRHTEMAKILFENGLTTKLSVIEQSDLLGAAEQCNLPENAWNDILQNYFLCTDAENYI